MRLIVVMALVLAGCPKKNVFRSSGTFAVETLSALKRQEEASAMLHKAAKDAKRRGDHKACVEYIGPALLIDASAKKQAYRALWLADLPYPVDGKTPPEGTEQPDPGPSGPPADPKEFCSTNKETP